MSGLQKNKSTQTSGSMFAERIEKAKKTKFEMELIETVDCFLDGHGNYDSNLGSFKTKSLKYLFFLLQLVRVMSVPKEYKMLVKNEIRIEKFQVLSDFLAIVLQRVSFQIKYFTTRQILKQSFHNVSDFEPKILQQVRLCSKTFFKKLDFAQKCAFKKSRFD